MITTLLLVLYCLLGYLTARHLAPKLNNPEFTGGAFLFWPVIWLMFLILATVNYILVCVVFLGKLIEKSVR